MFSIFSETNAGVVSSWICYVLMLVATWFVQRYLRRVTRALINSFVQTAESSIKGTKMGEDKKIWVLKQLEAAEIKTTKKVNETIDELVVIMNKEKDAAKDAIKKPKLKE